MRTINATLQAGLDAGTGSPFFRAYIWTGASYTQVQPLNYQIHNLKASVSFIYSASLIGAQWFYIERGLKINGTEYPVTSSIYYRTRLVTDERTYISLQGHIFENLLIDTAGDDEADNVLVAAMAQTLKASTQLQYENTISFPASAPWWKDTQFYPNAKALIIKAQGLENILRQKYLAQLCEVESNILTVVSSSQFEDDALFSFDADTLLGIIRIYEFDKARRFVWKDQNGDIHGNGTATNPIHNLGYIETNTDPTPAFGINSETQEYVAIKLSMPQLAITNGDPIDIDAGTPIHVLVKETFDINQTPAWYQELIPISWVGATEGADPHLEIKVPGRYTVLKPGTTTGSKTPTDTGGYKTPTGGEYSINFTPVLTGQFGDKLGETDSNIQEAFETLDKHTHTDPAGLTVVETNTNLIYGVSASPGGTSTFVGTIASKAGATVTYNVTSGTEGAMKPSATTHLGKLRLYNTTRGSYALISDVNTATNVITLTATVPAAWVATDVITIASQTVSGDGLGWIDVELTSGPMNHSALFIQLVIISATVGDAARVTPFSASYSSSKNIASFAQAVSINATMFGLYPVNSNVVTMSWTGTPTNVLIRESGYLAP